MPAARKSDRTLAAKIAANTRWAGVEDRAAATAKARAASMGRFERQVDPEGTLTPDERARRAENARKAWFQLMALKSAKARRRRRLAREVEAEADLDEVLASLKNELAAGTEDGDAA